jgi:predicted dehydrogenase
MLDSEELDILDICTPPSMHQAHIAAAVERGLHIMCQKPLAPSLAEAHAIAAKLTSVRFMVHENFRFRPWYREIAKQLSSGIIGEPFYCRSDGRMAGTVLTCANPDLPYSIARQP